MAEIEVNEGAKRRVFLLFSVFFFLGTLIVGLAEAERPGFSPDEVAVVGLSFMIMAFIAVWWKKRSLSELKFQNNVYAVLTALMVAAKMYGLGAEAGTDSMGDELFSIAGLLVMLGNRFF